MFKKINYINNTYALIKIDNVITDDLLNLNVIIEENNIKILGEITEIHCDEVKINFLGEFINDKLENSISKIPSINANIRIINNNELAEITNYYDDKSMLLGFLPRYNDSPIKVRINDIWNSNFALIGESNTGKTNASINIIKNLFSMPNYIPFNSIIFVINNNRDYYNELSSISNINFNLNYKFYTTDINQNENLLKIPLWLMDIDDYASILNITSPTQKSLINKLIEYASIFGKKDETSNNYKNYLISKAILRVLSTEEDRNIINKLKNILNICNTEKLNLDITLPHSNERLFDFNEGRIEKDLIIKYISNFNGNFNFSNTLNFFDLNDLITSINYILIDEEILDSNLYQDGLELKNKLNLFANSNINNYFTMSNYIDINQYISNILLINNNKKAQIINLIMENINIDNSKKIINIYLKILSNFINNLPNSRIMPIHVIINDIKNYIDNNDMINKIITSDNNIFIDFVTDNINKFDKELLSYYNNLLLFKSNRNYLDINDNIFNRQKLLKKDSCIVLGKMVHFPMIVNFSRAVNSNVDNNSEIFNKWMIMWKK